MQTMSVEFIFLLVLLVIIACVALWYAHRSKTKSSSQLQPETDPSLQQVASDKAHIDEAVITAVQQHEREPLSRTRKYRLPPSA